MSTYVVWEAQLGQQKLLAWCQTGGGPGYTEITYTGLDGTPVDADENIRMNRHLFTVDGEPEPVPVPIVLFTEERLVGMKQGDLDGAVLDAITGSEQITGGGPSIEIRTDVRRSWIPGFRRVLTTFTERP